MQHHTSARPPCFMEVDATLLVCPKAIRDSIERLKLEVAAHPDNYNPRTDRYMFFGLLVRITDRQSSARGRILGELSSQNKIPIDIEPRKLQPLLNVAQNNSTLADRFSDAELLSTSSIKLLIEVDGSLQIRVTVNGNMVATLDDDLDRPTIHLHTPLSPLQRRWLAIPRRPPPLWRKNPFPSHKPF